MNKSQLRAAPDPMPLRVQPVGSDAFRRAMGQFATGVTIITALDANGSPYGITVSSFASLSLDPLLVQWSLRRDAFSYGVFREAPHFAVNILASDQEELSRRFCTSIDRFDKLHHEEGLFGLPLLPNALASIECARVDEYPGGDHVIFIGQVIRARHRTKAPLLHWQGRYHRLGA